MAGKHLLQLDYEFNSKPEIIFENLRDLTLFGKYHPHMTDVKIVSDANPKEIEYEIFEEIYLFGFIKNHPQYKATVIEIEKNKRIQYRTQVKKDVFLTIDFTINENIVSGGTLLKENIAVTSSKFVAWIFLPILKKAHIQLFEKMKLNPLLS